MIPQPLWRRLRTLLLMTGLSLVSVAASAAPSFKRGVNISHWLSQNAAARPYGASWFGEADVAWIASQGYDHIRMPIDGRVWLKADGAIDDSKVKPFTDFLGWAKAHRLNVILDMHFLPGADFNDQSRDTRVFTDPALQAKVADFWRAVAKRFAGEGDYLRFEILNEPVAEKNEQLNPFQHAMLAAIRESNPTRVVYITSNRWSNFDNVKDVDVPKDPNVAITIHFYEPHVFTHQKASWVGVPPDMPLVPFPGRVPELDKHLPAGHFYLKHVGEELTIAKDIDAAFARVAEWAKVHAPGHEIHVGEFGVYDRVPESYRDVWIKAVVAAAARHDFGWAVWDYKGGFAVRNAKGEPTVIQRALGAK